MFKPTLGMLLVLLLTQVCTAQSTKVSPSIYDTGSGDNPGNVGVGTTAPAAKLEVAGGIRATGGPNPTAPSSGTGVEIGWDGTQGVVQVYDRTNGAGKPLWLNYGIGNTILGGNVGIGTTSPSQHLTLFSWTAQSLSITGDSGAQSILLGNQDSAGVNNPAIIQAGNGNVHIGHGSSWTDPNGGVFTPTVGFLSNGNVGIGTTNPGNRLQVEGYGSANGIGLGANGNIPNNVAGTIYATNEGNGNLHLGISRSGVGWGNLVFGENGGNVGIGTTNPAAKLEVNGNLKVSGAGSSITFADGTTQSTAWTGVLCGGDYAESVDVTGGKEHYEAGDVMVVDPKNDSFTRSLEPYSTEVSGVYSTKPGVLGRKSIDPEKTKAEVPMAMVGVVPTKVSAENGPIRRGDLLVTSSTPGHAMKGTDRSRMLGAVVGKALGSLDSGTGMIDILVTLQ